MILVIAVLILATGGVFVWLMMRPPQPEIADIIRLADEAAAEAGDSIRPVAALSVSIGEVDENVPLRMITAEVRWQAGQDLYEIVDTADWFRKSADTPVDVAASAIIAMSGSDWPHVARYMSNPVRPEPLTGIQLISRVAAAGAELRSVVRVVQEKGSGGWKMKFMENQWTTGDAVVSGEPRGTFRSDAFCVDDASDVGTLTSLADTHRAFAKSYREAREAHAAELARKKEEMIQGFLAQVAAGRVYRGSAVSTKDGAAGTLFLEFVESPSPRSVKAILRDSFGWDETRVFAGLWAYDEATGRFTVTLNTGRDDRHDRGGPWLSSSGQYNLTLTVANGRLVGTAGDDSHRLDLASRTKAEWASDQAEVRAPLARLSEALSVGLAYRGVMVSDSGVDPVDVILRVTRSEGGVAGVTVEDLKDPRHIRALKGTVLPNGHHNEGWPLRLSASSDERSAKGARWFSQGSVNTRWKLDGDKLVGLDDRGISFRLLRMTAVEVAAIDGQRARARAAVVGRIRPGTTYNGLVSHDGSAGATKARLTFTHLDEKTDTIECTLSSFRDPKSSLTFQGTFSTVDATLTLSRKGRSLGDGDAIFREAMNYQSELELTVLDQSLSKQYRDGKRVNLFFPYVGVPERIVLDRDGGKGVPAPELPGAYVRVGEQWSSLPTNNFHVVQSGTQIAGQVFGLLLSTSEQRTELANRPDFMGDIVFDGTSVVPAVSRGQLMICFRGVPADFLPGKDVPQDYPVMEVAALTVAADGSRKVPIYRIVPGLAGFVLNRLPAAVLPVSDDVIVYRSDSPVEPGLYAVAVGTRVYEVRVE